MALIAHYRLDGKTTNSVGDYSGVANGAIDWVDGKLGKCANFNNGYISNPAISDYLHGRPEASIALWVKKDNINFGLLQLSGFASSNGNIYPYSTNFNVYLDVFRTNRLGPLIMPSSVLDWHHLIITQAPGVWKLYQNGQLVHQATADQFVSTNYLEFEIGRNSNSRYHDGQISDVRVYDHALSEREVRDLSLGLAVHHAFQHDFYDAVRSVRARPTGDVQLEDIDGRHCAVINSSGKRLNIEPFSAPVATLTFWHKRDDAQSSSSYRTVLGCVANIHPAIFVQGTREFGLWDGSFKSSGYAPPNDGAFHFYTTVLQGDGTALFYVDGAYLTTVSTTLSLVNNPIDRIGSWTSYYAGIVGEVKLFATALTPAQVKELYQQKASIDSLGNIHSHRLLESGYKKPLMPSYEVWADGQSGSVTGFSQNGSSNTRVKAMGPHGNEIVIWKGNSNGANGANAGWNGDYFPIDPSKLYRFSVWLRREVQGNGRAYLGCRAQGGHVLRVPGGTTADSNPYFWSGTPGSEWLLVVGHVFPHGYTGPMHPESGRYTKAGRVGNISKDFAWQTSTASAGHRSYLYYASDATTEQHFAYPRVDLCDGTEPTVDELLLGHDLLWSQNGFPKELGISDRGLAVSSMSEIGPARGLVVWYPLDGDVKDYAGNRDGINGGATATADGYQFDLGAQIALPSDVGYADKVSVFLWFKPTGTAGGGYHTVLGGSELEISIPSTLAFVRTGVHTSGTRKADNYNSPLELNKWHLIGFSYADNKKTVYKNGVSIGTSSVAGVLDPIFSGRVIGSWGSFSTVGLIKDVRLYNRDLSPEEVATLYAITNPDSKQNMMVSADTTYAKGQFKEVIA